VHFGNDSSPAITIQVQPAAARGPGTADQPQVFMEATVDSKAPYVQQQVLLTIRIYHRISWIEASLSDPEFRGGEVLAEKLGEDRNFRVMRNGRQWNVIERRYALFPQSSGRIEMDPLVLNLRLPSGERKARNRSPFGDPFFNDFFSRQTYTRKVVRSQAIILQVRSVPAAFDGAQWLPARSIKLQESWSAPLDNLKTGEPVTRTLTLVADGVSLGQLPELTMADQPGLRIYPDDPETREEVTPDGVRSITVRKFAIIPVQAGEHRLPEVRLKWWNVLSDSEQVTTLPAHRLKVTGAAVQPSPTSGASAPVVPAERGTPPAPEKAEKAPLPAWTLVEQLPGGPQRWLLITNLLFLTLWLITLMAWLHARGRRAGEREKERTQPEEKILEAPLWNTLHRAATGENAEKMRQALLELAPVLWPEHPPRSLEAMARRTDSPLRDELNHLSRRLYGNGEETWNGERIEAELKKLREARSQSNKKNSSGALQPLYPDA
jgi:hypothetical protein